MPIGIFNGRWKLGSIRDRLAYQYNSRHFIVEQNKLDFGDALAELKQADPMWEAWFDDDDNIPPYISWLDTDKVNELCKRMIARAQEIINADSS